MISTALQRAAAKPVMLDAVEERDLIARAQAGDLAARDRIVLAHLRMVVAAAYRLRHHGIPVDDLVHEGVLALMHALEGFDLAQPVRFSTFALWTLRARLDDAVMRTSTVVRISGSTRNKALFFQARGIRTRLERDGRLSRGEVDRRLAAELGVAVEVVEATGALLNGTVAISAPATGSARSGSGRSK